MECTSSFLTRSLLPCSTGEDRDALGSLFSTLEMYSIMKPGEFGEGSGTWCMSCAEAFSAGSTVRKYVISTGAAFLGPSSRCSRDCE